MTETTHAATAWRDFLDRVRACEVRLASAAPDAGTASEAYGYLGRLTSSILGQVLSPQDLTIGGIYYPAARIGGANPDYRMGTVRIDPASRYRLFGRFNDASRIAFGLYTPQPQAALDLDDYHAVWAKDGEHFSVTIGGEAATMQAKPSTALLMVRELQLRPGGARAEIKLEQVDGGKPSISAAPAPDEALAASLTAASAQLDALIDQFIRWANVITMTTNTITQMPDELDQIVRGDADTRYFTGHFNLEPDQAFEIDMPNIDADYWMVQALTHWLEPIPGANLNMATIDPRSRTVIVSARNPGRPNWFDIGHRRHGHILCRAVGASATLVPASRVVTASAGVSQPRSER